MSAHTTADPLLNFSWLTTADFALVQTLSSLATALHATSASDEKSSTANPAVESALAQLVDGVSNVALVLLGRSRLTVRNTLPRAVFGERCNLSRPRLRLCNFSHLSRQRLTWSSGSVVQTV